MTSDENSDDDKKSDNQPVEDKDDKESLPNTDAQSPPDLGISVADDTTAGEHFGP